MVWLEKHVDGTNNPRQQGKALIGNLKGFWRYRVGHYRIICRIEDEELIIVAVSGGHCKDIYKK